MGDFFDEPPVYHTPFGSTITYGPYTSAFGSSRQWGATTLASDLIGSVYSEDYLTKQLEKEKKEIIGDVDIIDIKSSKKGEHIVACQNESDLSVDRILKTLSALKGKLMLNVAPVHIQKLECRMTPTIRKNIVMASKKLKMYGKKRPIIARFDEYGNRLPDEIELEIASGVTLVIVDPREYRDCYLELKAIEFPTGDYTIREDYIYPSF